MKPILTLLSLVLSLHSFAQYDTMGRFLIRQLPTRFFAVKWAPMSLAELDNSNIAVALERRFNEKSGVQLQLGYTLPLEKSIDGAMVKANGFRVRLDYRRYVIPLLYNGDWYWAPELFYTQYRSPAVDFFDEEVTGINAYEDEFIIDKKMYGLTGKFGFQRRFLKHFLFEASIGMGLKYRQVTHIGRIDETDVIVGRHPNIYNISHATGKEMTFAMSGNLFIGYFFH